MIDRQELRISIGLKIKLGIEETNRDVSKKCSCKDFQRGEKLSLKASMCPYCGTKDLISIYDKVRKHVLLNETIKEKFPKTALKIEYNPYDNEVFSTCCSTTVCNKADDFISFDLKIFNTIANKQLNDFKSRCSEEIKYLESLFESVEVVSLIECEYEEENY